MGVDKRRGEVRGCHPLKLQCEKGDYHKRSNDTLKQVILAQVLVHECRYPNCHLEIEEEYEESKEGWMVFGPHLLFHANSEYDLSEWSYSDIEPRQNKQEKIPQELNPD